jgi:prepilin-type N-terminal cleavage/methylation domain-containing protein
MAGLRVKSIRNRQQKGFTIIELMISMTIFAVIMLICVSVFIQISRLYTKGVTVSRTQESARAILDELTREIQFSSSPVVATPAVQATDSQLQHYCIGGNRYSYKLNTMKTDIPSGATEALHVLQKDSVATIGGCPVPLVDGQGKIQDAVELMTDHTALRDFEIVCGADQVSCRIKIVVTYGDPNDNSIFEDEGTPTKRVCRGGIIGSEFCTVVELNATVTRRLR